MIQKYIRYILIICLVLPLYAYAKGIPCPSINLLQDAADKINIATKFNGFYTVYTMDYVFVENNVYWRVGVNQLIASSDEEALEKGKEHARHITFKEDEEAIEINPGLYKCNYAPGYVYALGFTK